MYHTKQMPPRVKRFERLCVREHGKRNQRYGKFPYGFHLRGVRDIAMYYRFDSIDAQMLCLGHDLDEDTSVSHQDKLRAGASHMCIRYIWCLTDEPGANRRERKAKTYWKIRLYVFTIASKLADRMRNLVQGFIEGDTWSFDLYLGEMEGFEKGIGMVNDIRLRRMWADLKWMFAHGEELRATIPHGEVPYGAPAWMKPIVLESRTFRSMVP